jgi:hypothetical protein
MKIGPGSKLTAMKAAYPTARCDAGTSGICRISGAGEGSPVTDFFFDGGKITRVTVGYIQD